MLGYTLTDYLVKFDCDPLDCMYPNIKTFRPAFWYGYSYTAAFLAQIFVPLKCGSFLRTSIFIVRKQKPTSSKNRLMELFFLIMQL